MSLDDQGNATLPGLDASSALRNAAASETTPFFTALLYPTASSDSATLAALATSLQSFIDEALLSIGGYIWHRESPLVRVSPTSSSAPAHLRIGVRTGACVEDEWLLIHLLRLASSSPRFASADLAISVRDEDGEILLIEAAEELPEWVTPECAEARCWIYRGALHLLPPELCAGKGGTSDAPKGLETHEALTALRVNSASTAQEALTRAAFARLTTYPALDWAKETQHRTLVYLPRRAALVLAAHAQLISAAAEALEGREGPADARALGGMSVFGPAASGSKGADREMASTSTPAPGSREENIILTPLSLPRATYATLLSHRFFPPKSFGAPWRRAVEQWWALCDAERSGAPLPPDLPSDEEGQEKCRVEGRRRDLGAKIAAGLEVLLARARGPRAAKAWGDNSDPRTSPEYAPFLASLARLGWFESELEGSARWKELERSAVERWVELRRAQAAAAEEDNTGHVTDDYGAQISDVLNAEGTPSAPALVALDSSAPSAVLASYEASDAFLADAPPAFSRMDTAADGSGSAAAGAGGEEMSAEERAAEAQLKAFAERLEGFVEGEGDVEGALFPDEMDDPDSSDDEDQAGETAQQARARVAGMSSEERARAVQMLVPAQGEEEWVPASSAAADEVKDTQMDEPSTSRHAPKEPSASAPPTQLGGAVPPTPEQIDAAAIEAARTAMLEASASLAHAPTYDGASDSEESVDDEVLRSVETEQERRERAQWLGMEDELDEDNRERARAEQEEEGGFRMEDEMAGFVEFARKSLGISEAQFEQILSDRKNRGAFVPPRETKAGPAEATGGEKIERKSAKVKFADQMELDTPLQQQDKTSSSPLKPTFGPPRPPTGPAALASKPAPPLKPTPTPTAVASSKPTTSSGQGITTPSEREAARLKAERVTAAAERCFASRSAVSSAAPPRTPNAELNSFEKVMAALDGELAKHRSRMGEAQPSAREDAGAMDVDPYEDYEEFEPRARPARARPPAPLPRRVDAEGDEEMDSDEELSAQDAELLQKLMGSGAPASLAPAEGGAESHLADLLRSFKGQGAGPGPVGTLAGRLGTGLPGDADR